MPMPSFIHNDTIFRAYVHLNIGDKHLYFRDAKRLYIGF